MSTSVKKLLNLILLSLIALVLFQRESWADVKRIVETVASATSVSSVQVGGTNTTYSKSISLQNVTETPVSIMYKATSDGIVTAKIDLEQSYQRPSTEGASDSNYMVTSTVNSSLVNEEWHIATLSTVEMPFIRFKLTGSGSNDNSTTVQFKVGKQ